jgi:hypothetical protein
MYATKDPDEGEVFGVHECELMEAIGRAWYKAAVSVMEFCMTPFLHDSNTPAKGDKELKTTVTVPFERLLQKYLVSKGADMERFTVCYDHEERALLEAMLQRPVEMYGVVFELFLRLD